MLKREPDERQREPDRAAQLALDRSEPRIADVPGQPQHRDRQAADLRVLEAWTVSQPPPPDRHSDLQALVVDVGEIAGVPDPEDAQDHDRDLEPPVDRGGAPDRLGQPRS